MKLRRDMNKIIPAQPRSGRDIDKKALDLVRYYQPRVLTHGESFDICSFFEFELPELSGVDVDYQRLNPGIYGYTDSEQNVCVISADLAEDQSQELFLHSTIAHETGHVIFHVPEFRQKRTLLKSILRKEDVSGSLLHRAVDVPTYRNPEWQAWHFAGALLMPAPAFIEAMNKGYGDHELSKRFRVNPKFVQNRRRAIEKL
jgi:Zn-dependent peptidase ImmA (M78 family)